MELLSKYFLAVYYQVYSTLRYHSSDDAFQVMFGGYTTNSTSQNLELVACKLILFYDYWSMNEVILLLKGHLQCTFSCNYKLSSEVGLRESYCWRNFFEGL